MSDVEALGKNFSTITIAWRKERTRRSRTKEEA
jgi:hypothetical protein